MSFSPSFVHRCIPTHILSLELKVLKMSSCFIVSLSLVSIMNKSFTYADNIFGLPYFRTQIIFGDSPDVTQSKFHKTSWFLLKGFQTAFHSKGSICYSIVTFLIRGEMMWHRPCSFLSVSITPNRKNNPNFYHFFQDL